MGWGTGGFSGWGWLMMILMVFFWGLAIWAIFSVIGGWTSKKRDGEIPIHGESALGLLKKRYAAGEITREEYETLRDDLSR
ncbi:MAG: hypothetical protein FJZ95_02940 [Chloroflexi bacterium]|nr:hypothetical protein [Chloroflexota bacterium]